VASDNAEAYAILEAQKQKLRGLKDLANDVAPAVADELRKELQTQIAEGKAPDGSEWPKTQDGRVPLRNAASALDVKAVGSVVVARLTGPTALHHLGFAAGGIRRQILPSRVLPQNLIAAISRVLGIEIKDRLE
jgi:hypothetical protein